MEKVWNKGNMPLTILQGEGSWGRETIGKERDGILVSRESQKTSEVQLAEVAKLIQLSITSCLKVILSTALTVIDGWGQCLDDGDMETKKGLSLSTENSGSWSEKRKKKCVPWESAVRTS